MSLAGLGDMQPVCDLDYSRKDVGGGGEVQILVMLGLILAYRRSSVRLSSHSSHHSY